jgi:hypothetical protein
MIFVHLALSNVILAAVHALPVALGAPSSPLRELTPMPIEVSDIAKQSPSNSFNTYQEWHDVMCHAQEHTMVEQCSSLSETQGCLKGVSNDQRPSDLLGGVPAGEQLEQIDFTPTEQSRGSSL